MFANGIHDRSETKARNRYRDILDKLKAGMLVGSMRYDKLHVVDKAEVFRIRL